MRPSNKALKLTRSAMALASAAPCSLAPVLSRLYHLASYTPMAYAKACCSSRLLCSPDSSGRASTTTSTGPFS